MAVALRGSAGGRLTSATVPWPAGTTVGDLALIRCVSDGFTVARPQSVGWTPSGNDAWWKVLTAADVAAPLPLTGSGFNLAVFTGAGSIGRYSSQTGVTVAAAGSGLRASLGG